MAKKRKKKKVKRNYTRLKRMLFGLIVIAVFINIFIFKKTSIDLYRKGYSSEERKILLDCTEEEILEYLSLDEKIDLEKWNEYSNSHHYYDYELYQRANTELTEMTVIKNVDRLYEIYEELVNLGYSRDYCRKHYSDYRIEDFEVFAKNQIDYDTAKQYLKVNGAVIDDLPQYVNSGSSAIKAVMKYSYGFIDSSVDCSDIYQIDPEDSLTAIVKDRFVLSKNYKPENLVKVDVSRTEDCTNYKLVEEAAIALEDMVSDAKEKDLEIVLTSGYESYSYQKKQYDEYANIYGTWAASVYLIEPGINEHQLGTCVDLESQKVLDGEELVFEDTNEYAWLVKHAYEYGFILRYPENQEDTTGTSFKPNHFRYVGKEAAKEIKENGWTLEEYVLAHGLDYSMKKLEDAG